MAPISAMAALLASLPDASSSAAIAAIREGISPAEFRHLSLQLGFSIQDLAAKLRVGHRTITRHLGSRKPLPPEISEKVVRLVRSMRKARLLLFADEASVVAWLKTEAPALGGACPIDLFDTDVGAAQVESLILGLAYGNFQ